MRILLSESTYMDKPVFVSGYDKLYLLSQLSLEYWAQATDENTLAISRETKGPC